MTIRNAGPRDHYMYQQQYLRAQDMHGQAARSPYILRLVKMFFHNHKQNNVTPWISFKSRSPMMPGSAEQKELISDADEPLATSPPLELRRPASGPLRSASAVPHSLQSPQDRATGMPRVCRHMSFTAIYININFTKTHRK